MKKLLPITVGILLSTSVLARTTFSDVQPTDPHADAIGYLVDNQIAQGYDNGTFGSLLGMNRAEFTKLVVASRVPAEVIAACDVNMLPFPEWDVPKDSWFAPYICIAYESQLIDGYPDRTFKPGNLISFVEVAKITAKAFGLEVVEAKVWYQGYVEALANIGAIPTDVAGFGEPITRGQMASITYRVHAGMKNEPSLSFEELEKGVEEINEEEEIGNEKLEMRNENQENFSLPISHSSFNQSENPVDDSAVLDDILASLNYLPPTVTDQAKATLSHSATQEGAYRVYNKDNVYVYVKREGSQTTQVILLITGEVKPAFVQGYWTKLEGTKLYNLIATSVRTEAQNNIPAAQLPGELGRIVAAHYSGQLDLKLGAHATAQIEVHGILGEVLRAMKVPTDNLIAQIGQDVSPLSFNSKPTHYLEILHQGIWSEPLDMAKTSLVDTIFYLDDGPTFGFWGKGTFDGEPIAMFYKGPLKFSKDPRDYLEAQVGFAAEEMSLAQYLKLIAAYSSRYLAPDAGLNAYFASLDALPLDVVRVFNRQIANLDLRLGKPFPGPDVFNLMVLGPLAKGKDGTSGPYAKIRGDGQLFGQTFGQLDFTLNTSGAKGTMNGALAIDLGSAAGQDLGDIGGNVAMSLHADAQSQAMGLKGMVNAGVFGGRELDLNLTKSSISFNSPATCTLPFDIKGTMPMPSGGAASLTSLQFSPETALPDPAVLLGCPEDIFMMIKNGVVYAFNGTQQLAAFAADLLPENDVTKFGAEGIKLAGGAISAGGEALLNAAKSVPGATELNALGQQGIDEAKRLADKAAKEAAKAAEKAAKKAARKAKKAAEKAAAEAAKAAEQAYNQSLKFTNDLTSGVAGKAIDGVASFGSSVANEVGSWFGGGGSSLPGFGWKHHVGWKAIDISIGHNNELWYIAPDGQAWYAPEAGTHNYRPYQAMGGHFSPGFSGFVRIDADDQKRAVAVTKQGHMYYVDTNGMWRRSDNPADYAIDIGIGGGWLWAISTQKHPSGWPGYKIYRTRYQSGRGNWTWEEVPGAALRIDVGHDGRPWVINTLYEVWEYKNGWQNRQGKALDISISRSNRAWIIGTNYNPGAGGGQIFTYERDRHIDLPLTGRQFIAAHWAATAGWAKNIGAGKFTSVIVSNHANNVYGGTGRE